jgi:hypothetical protein
MQLQQGQQRQLDKKQQGRQCQFKNGKDTCASMMVTMPS